MQHRLRTPLLAIALASISLLGFACGDDDGNDLDPLPTIDQDPTQPTPTIDTPSNGGNGDGESPAPEPEGQIGGTVSAQGNVEGDFVPQSALATVEGDLQVLLANMEGESVTLHVQSDGAMTMETFNAVFIGSGADVETAGDGTGVCGVQLDGTELTDAEGGNVQLEGELTITSANC